IIAMNWERGDRWPGLVAVAGTLCVLASFGHMLTWNRADPLLLLCATVALACVVRSINLWVLGIAALLAGAATALKAHGGFYVVPALWLWATGRTNRSTRGWT